MQKRSRGFNIIELMAVLTIAGIILAVGVPSFNSSVKNSRLTAAANDVVSAIHVARSEAGKRSVPVILCRTDKFADELPECGSGASWKDGWVVFADNNADGVLDAADDIISRNEAQSEKIAVKSHPDIADQIQFRANGFAVLPSGGSLSRLIAICDIAGDENFSRAVHVSNSGRPRVIGKGTEGFTIPVCNNN